MSEKEKNFSNKSIESRRKELHQGKLRMVNEFFFPEVEKEIKGLKKWEIIRSLDLLPNFEDFLKEKTQYLSLNELKQFFNAKSKITYNFILVEDESWEEAITSEFRRISNNSVIILIEAVAHILKDKKVEELYGNLKNVREKISQLMDEERGIIEDLKKLGVSEENCKNLE